MTYGDGLYVKVYRKEEETGRQLLVTLPLNELTPQEWRHWVQRWYMMESTPVKTLEEWQAVPAEYPPAPEF